MPMDRPWWDAWVDDDGSGNVGTVWNKAEIKKLVDGLDPSLHVGQFYAPTNVAVASGWATPNLYGLDLLVGVTNQAVCTFQIASGGGGLYLVHCAIQWAVVAAGQTRGAMFTLGGANKGQQFAPTFSGVAGASVAMSLLLTCVPGQVVGLATYADTATEIMAESRFGIARL